MKNVEAQLPRGIGILLSITAILFIAALVWHSMVHPYVGATSDQALPLIQAQANSWMAMHLFFALAAILLAAAGISLLSAQSSLTGFSFGLVGWSLMVVLSVLLAVLALIEATAQGYTAAVGDIRNFEITYEISRGFELVLFSLWPIAFAAIVLDDLRARAQLVPGWASGLALVGCVLLLVAVITTSGLRIVDLGPLWAAGMLPAGWLLWQSLSLGFRGATKRTAGVGLAASGRSGE